MNKNAKCKTQKLTISIHLLLSAICLPVTGVLSSVGFSQSRVVKFTPRPQLSFTLSTIYDDNIFKYSKVDLNNFRNQIRNYAERTSRFPFRTADDFIVLLNPTITIPVNKIPNTKYQIPKIHLNYKQYHYTINAEKSYQIISLGIHQPLSSQIATEINYLYLPRYLIRYYRDPLVQSTKYIPCIFSEHLLTIEMVYRLYDTKIKPIIRYEINNYERNFDFYDSKAIRYGLNITPKIRKLLFEFSFEQKHNYAKGPIPDISYIETNLSIGFKREITRFLSGQVIFGIDADWSKRTYTTKNSYHQDPYHQGRTDTKYGWRINWEYRITKQIHLISKYENEVRNVNSLYRVDIDDIKDYRTNRWSVGIKLTPRLK
ncbi:MAG: hypothetical protein N2201_05290 [candidate division WOR-3 bacterium]|nr:hypothetical protein [candidate division WOR-3 bacterium]